MLLGKKNIPLIILVRMNVEINGEKKNKIPPHAQLKMCFHLLVMVIKWTAHQMVLCLHPQKQPRARSEQPEKQKIDRIVEMINIYESKNEYVFI